MSAAVQISGNKSAGTAPVTGTQSPAIGAPASSQEFNILLQMLASLTTPGSVPQPASGLTASPATSTGKDASGSESQAANPVLLKLEQELSALISGDAAGSQSKSSQDVSQAAAYVSAGLPFIPQLQQPVSQASQPQSGTDGQSQTQAVLLSQLEKDLAAFLSTGGSQLSQSQSVTVPGEQATAQQAQPAQTSGAAQAQDAAASSAVKSDILKLLAATSGVDLSAKAVKELNAIAGNTQGNVSAQDVLQKLKAASSAATTAQNGQAAQSSNGSIAPVTPAVQQAQVPTQDLTLPAVKLPVQTNPVTAANAQSGQVSGQSTAVAATGSAAPTQTSTSNGTGNQNAGQSSATVSNQAIQVQGAAADQGNQNPTSSDKGSSDLLKADASQVYAAASTGSKGSVSFQQTLSAASQNAPAPPARPDITQLTQSIVREARIMTQQGKTVVNMKLEPDSLGSVTLQVSSEGGKISAQFNVKTADARAYLEASVPQMKQMLETNGVTVSHLNVSLSGGGDLQSGHQSFGYQPRRQRAGYSKYYSSQAAVTTAAAAPENSRSFGYNTMEMQI